MKKKKVNALLACLLAFTMAFSQPAAVFAEEAVQESSSAEYETEENAQTDKEAEASTQELTVEEKQTQETAAEESKTIAKEPETEETTVDEAAEEKTETDETTAAETAVEETTEEETTVDETDTEEAAVEETTVYETVTEETTVDETAVEETTVDETETEDSTVVISDGEQILSAEKQKELDELGFKTMKLSEEMLLEKKELSTVVSAIKGMEADADYIEHEIVFAADSEEQAEQIADCYGGEIKELEYGIAVAVISETVLNAVEKAADTEIWLPAVYPNIVYNMYGEYEETDAVFEADSDEGLIDESDVEHETALDEDELNKMFPSEDEHLYASAPNDKYFNAQWHHDNMNTVEAWNASKGKGVTVAVIDTGIDYNHPDLKANIEGYVSVIGGDGKDDNGHGTHCSGIIAAAAGNSIGVSGIAPEAKIYSVKVLNKEGSAYTADIVQGVNAATDKEVDVISMSLGGLVWDRLFQSAINDAVNEGIVVVAAAGNESTDQKSYPAAYDNVISVAATTSYDSFAYFSNYGSWVDIAAPGYNILSTLPTDFRVDGCTYVSSGYGYMSGTSMACPAVAATVALILGNSEELKNNNTKAGVQKLTNTLLDSSVQNGAYGHYKYYPLIDAEAAAYAVESGEIKTPEISFSKKLTGKNEITIDGYEDVYFELKTETEHAKIYYTINGKKPTPETGYLYRGKISMYASGKYKIQAVAVIGNRTSKVFSQSYKIDAKVAQVYATDADMTVAAGSSIQLSAYAYPYYATNTKLEWSCDDTTGMIKVAKGNGKVTCNKNAEKGFKAVVTAKAKDGSDKECKITVTVVEDKVDELKLNTTELNMSRYPEYYDKSENVVSSFKLVPETGSVKTTQYIYKSSNTKVATVGSDGTVWANGKGKAKITVMANDGSGKKAVCNVNVTTPIFYMYTYSSTGYSDMSDYIPIGTGCTITMKPVVNYNSSYYLYKPTNSKLEWTSDNKYVTVKNGKVKCDAKATPGTKVKVMVKPADGKGESRNITFMVTDKIEKLYMTDIKGKEYTAAAADISLGSAIWCPSSNGLYVKTKNNTGKFYNGISIDISNRDSIYRYYDIEYGNIILGTKPGTSKITYTARDGSNAKFTLTVNVKEQ